MKEEKFTECIQNINNIIMDLSESLTDSRKTDRELLRHLHVTTIKNDTLNVKLKESQDENAQLLEILRNKSEDRIVGCETDINKSCSTMSIVHLQYKYEELLSNHNGLLKVLDMRTNEIRKCSHENNMLKEENERLKLALENCKKFIMKLQQKLSSVKEKRRLKVSRLQQERDTLKAIHNQLIVLLHNQCMEKDNHLLNLIHTTESSDRALLLQEIRKNNILSYESVKQKQELDYLRSILKVTHAVEQQIN